MADDEETLRRIAELRQRSIDATRQTFRQTFGDRAETALAAPAVHAAIDKYVDTILDLMRAQAAFSWVEWTTTAPFVDAAIAYRDAQLALIAAHELVAREVLGLTDH